jgi:hypothetical protein
MACLYGSLPSCLVLRKVFQIQGLGLDFGCKLLILNVWPVKS